MKIYTLERRITVPAAVAETFAFFEDPSNLARITPPWLGFRILSPEPVAMRYGAEIDYRIRVAGIPLVWKTLITEYEPPFLFTDQQVAGPYRYWRHRHEFHPSPQGTVVRDRVDYALPLGFIGRLAHWLYVRRKVQEIFEYRAEALIRIFNAAMAR